MGNYFKLFNTHSEYETYINDSDKILPNMSYCVDNDEVHFNHLPASKFIAKFNVTSTDSATQICSTTSSFSEIEIDGVALPNVVTSYTFETTGEHTVKYTLLDSTRIDNFDFNNCVDLTSITIPSSVTSIGQAAFGDCSNLTNIDIPSSVTSIGNYAFQYCSSLTSITIPSSVTNIGTGAFIGCSGLISIDIPSSVTSIDTFTFQGCSGLTSVNIPNSVTSIGERAFDSCSSLNSITSQATKAPTIQSYTFASVKTGGTLYVPTGSTGYDVWMGTGNYYLGKYNWTKVEQ